MTVLLWFKRDLRIHDHPALNLAAGLGPVLPVYIVEPDYWALPDTSARQWGFTRDSVLDLARHVPLAVGFGTAVDVLEALRVQHGVTQMVSHEETGNAWTYARDQAVAAWARGAGVVWREVPQSGVVRRLPGRDGWALHRNRFLAQPQQEVPQGLSWATGAAGDLKDPPMAPDPCPERQKGGRQEALSLLGGFLTERGRPYRRAMSSPLAGEWACSRLSPHLALGTLSGREVAQAASARAREVKGTREGWGGSMKSFQARLAWRDHFMQKLEDEPEVEHRCFHPAFETVRPRDSASARLHAWAEGQTGIPFVDACMRFTRATGWLNFRMRAMVTAVASYHFWLDWRDHGVVLARLFTDYEPGIHWSQVQMQSGTTGINTPRIYNPIKQGQDQDPEGIFTRRWIPELADVPDPFLQTPWSWDGADRLSYPAPIVDVTEAARAARAAIWAVRKDPGFRGEAARVVEKHASRKDPQGHFVNDRTPTSRRSKPRKSSPDQLSFDF